MKKSSNTKKVLRNFLICLIFIEIIGFIFFIAKYLPSIDQQSGNSALSENKRNHIVLLGNSEYYDFLQQVYKGAYEEGLLKDAVVDFYAPASKAEDIPLEKLISHACFVNADGIIACVPEGVDSLEVPVRSDGSEIPLVTLGHNSGNIKQISFVGSNASETGKILGQEAVANYNDGDSIIILDSESRKSTNLSLLKNSLIQKLKINGIFDFYVFDDSYEENLLALKKLLYESKEKQQNFIIVAISEDDTISASQQVIDFELKDRTKILGFGENPTAELYFSSGTITELFSMDMEQIGKMAVRQLFEFINYGSANRIVTADIKIRYSEKNKNPEKAASANPAKENR